MGITSVNIANGASYGAYNQKLTPATRAKLEELGIAYDASTTEQEARRKIREHELTNKEKLENKFNQNDNQPKDELLERAKKLAEKVGIQVEEGMQFTQIIAIIESSLESKVQQNSNDVAMLTKLQGLSQELANLQAQAGGYSGYDNTNEALMMSLEMLGQYNKNFLHR